MNQKRLAFALERISPDEWARFEKFASQFLVPDYPGLRTVAAASGDLDRDSELFSPEGDSSVLLQYSVTKNWAPKIRGTAKRIRQNFPDASILIYVTNQVIGADGDEIKKELRKDYRLVLDIHDRGWFLDRITSPQERSTIAEQLARDIVDPYLASREVIETKALALTELEAKPQCFITASVGRRHEGKGTDKTQFRRLGQISATQHEFCVPFAGAGGSRRDC